MAARNRVLYTWYYYYMAMERSFLGRVGSTTRVVPVCDTNTPLDQCTHPRAAARRCDAQPRPRRGDAPARPNSYLTTTAATARTWHGSARPGRAPGYNAREHASGPRRREPSDFSASQPAAATTASPRRRCSGRTRSCSSARSSRLALRPSPRRRRALLRSARAARQAGSASRRADHPGVPAQTARTARHPDDGAVRAHGGARSHLRLADGGVARRLRLVPRGDRRRNFATCPLLDRRGAPLARRYVVPPARYNRLAA